jgi:hypothetical protein
MRGEVIVQITDEKEGKRRPRGAGRTPRAAPRAENGSLTYEQIARRAYEIYLARGSEPGRELEDWLQAERELRDERSKSHAN